MSDSQLIVTESDGILIAELNRLGKHNAISRVMLEGLSAAVEQLATREELKVLLIRAQGDKYFSTGADLSELSAKPDDSPSEFRLAYRTGPTSFQALADEFESVEKPVVVAHQATCLGGALELSLSCDFRLAAHKTRYGLPEIAMGLIPGSGGTSRLTRLVGPHWARWLIMLNKQIDADRALAIGLVHEVYADEDFDKRVWEFCRQLAAQPPEALAAAKLAIELSADLDRAQGRNVERLVASTLYSGAEHRTLLSALREKLSGGKKDK
jgi:enoyl-CoA hydratase/carnithine racemase